MRGRRGGHERERERERQRERQKKGIQRLQSEEKRSKKKVSQSRGEREAN